jgi:hypothetical protein
VNEVARLQVADPWFHYLASYGVPGFKGTCSVHINRRKNDTGTQRKGHYPALGHSRDLDLELAQLRRWMEVAELVVHPSCVKRTQLALQSVPTSVPAYAGAA